MASDFRKLVIHLATLQAVPKGGNFADGVDFLLNSQRVAETLKECEQLAEQICQSVMATHNNPYGADRDAIAAEILRRIEENSKGVNFDRN